eukprot:gene27737-35037_t
MLLSLAIVLFLRGEAAQQACSITDFGAVPGGSEVDAGTNTKAINAAIKECHAKYPTGLEAGAHVLSTNNEAWYRQVPCLPNESREPIRNQGFISGWNMTRTSITGAGPALSTIDGNGPVWNNYTADHKDQVHAHKYARPFLINPMWSTEFSVTNVTLKDSAFWTMTPFGCDGIYMADVNITSANSAGNTD